MKHEIQIEAADENTGSLVLKINGVDADSIVVKQWNRVTWAITAVNLYSFRIAENNGSEQIFLFAKPSSKHTKNTKGWISPFAKKGAVYNYSIWWRARENSKELQHDPKITVKP